MTSFMDVDLERQWTWRCTSSYTAVVGVAQLQNVKLAQKPNVANSSQAPDRNAAWSLGSCTWNAFVRCLLVTASTCLLWSLGSCTWNAFVSCFMVVQVRYSVQSLVRACQNTLQKVILRRHLICHLIPDGRSVMFVTLVGIRFSVFALATMPLHLVRVAKSSNVSLDIIRGPD